MEAATTSAPSSSSPNGSAPGRGPRSYDAIVVGGGHNGLTTTAYLAKAGLRVICLERRDILGGACVTEELIPGSKWSSCAFIAGLLRPEIIAELEPERRGAYAGAVGYFSPDGSMDSCIVLRTGVVKDGTLHVQAGAGIVADSDPVSEQRECEAKAGALFAAAREAYARASAVRFGQ